MALAHLSTAFSSKTNDNVLYLDFNEEPAERHPAIVQGNDRMKAANEAWNCVNADQFKAWKRYADTIEYRHPKTGGVYHPTAKNAFVSNALKLLQVDPQASVPLNPPAMSYDGDTVSVRVCEAAANFFGFEEPSTITFCADGPNQLNTVTEILVQKLKNCRRTPTSQYRSIGFVKFENGCLSHDVTLDPGLYSCAYRFVEKTTGQASHKVVLGTFEVE